MQKTRRLKQCQKTVRKYSECWTIEAQWNNEYSAILCEIFIMMPHFFLYGNCHYYHYYFYCN